MLNKLIVAGLPLVPRPIIRKISRRYIAGDRLADAIAATRRLNRDEGAWTTIDVLGEFVDDRERAVATLRDCTEVLSVIDREGLHGVANLSIKPTSLGLGVDEEFAFGNIRELALKARGLGMFMQIDMENTPYTDLTLRTYRRLRDEGIDNVGIVLQAMLHRTEQDVRSLREYRPTVRLCKGIYKEARSVAWTGREDVRASYKRLLRLIVESGMYACIATHDDPLIADAKEVVAAHGLGKDQYEFQMLLGVRENVRRQILAAGHHLRVYVPFGEDWYGYSSRRLKENPDMAGMIAKAVLLRQ
ncbi:MAG TPA: proline dehydrogenase family protein [Candidatus Krumholzibacteria bacterium]|nr:proline dehydrogenase family protein [Candidatus Krumholzibacteria bacterium]HPD70522.1 proline dehydrogenase family protein [Candidatus Krumholzibacteria bacterium]HRY39778.1 proline dehydrogenase family protein [Candidatus Krumholzibacteria bacterium]